MSLGDVAEAATAKGIRGNPRPGRASRQAFLDHLAETGDVAGAAATAGETAGAFHRLCRRDAVFAEAWRAAVSAGFARLEEALLAGAIAGLASRATAPERPADGGVATGSGEAAVRARRSTTGCADVQLALALLARRPVVTAPPSGGSRRPEAGEVATVLTDKLDRLARRLAATGR